MKNKFLKQFLSNWFDLIGLGIFFAGLTIAAFFFLRKADYVTITLRISKSDQLPTWSNPEPLWYLEHITKGLSDKDILGRTNLEVQDVYYYPNNGTEQTVFVDLLARAVYNKRTKTYTYNGSSLFVSTHQDFNISGVQVSGVIYDINHSFDHQKEKRIVYGELEIKRNEDTIHLANTEFEGIKKYVSKKIGEGMDVKDSRGNVIAKILTVKKEPAYKTFIFGNKLTRVIDPERERVYLTVELELVRINGKDLYKQEVPVLVNSNLALEFQDFGIILTVIDANVQQK